MHRTVRIFLAIAALASSGVLAQTTGLVGAEFQAQAEQIRKDLAAGEKYSEIDAEDRASVLSLLERLEARLNGVSDLDALPEQARVSIYNDQEALNTILTGAAADSRQSCRREHVVGSNRRQNVCMTVAERRRRADRSREDMGDMQRMFPGNVQP